MKCENKRDYRKYVQGLDNNIIWAELSDKVQELSKLNNIDFPAAATKSGFECLKNEIRRRYMTLKGDLCREIYSVRDLLDKIDDLNEEMFTYNSYTSDKLIYVAKLNYQAITMITDILNKYDFYMEGSENEK